MSRIDLRTPVELKLKRRAEMEGHAPTFTHLVETLAGPRQRRLLGVRSRRVGASGAAFSTRERVCSCLQLLSIPSCLLLLTPRHPVQLASDKVGLQTVGCGLAVRVVNLLVCQFQRALELNPSCAPARQWYAEFLAEMGRIDDSLATIERARTDDPLSRGIQACRAFVLWLGRRFDEAIAQAEQVLEIDPNYPMALIRLGVAYEGKGMHAEAVQAFRRAKDAAPGLLDCIALLGHAHARAGCARDALKQLNELRRLARRRYVPPFLFASVYLGLGDQDKAVRFMEDEYDARGWYLLLIRQAPQFDSLRSHPRFHALIRRMNFPT